MDLWHKAHVSEDKPAQEDWRRRRLFKHGFTGGTIRDMQEVKSLE